eukprot:jgi/Ulvmu1/9458/UM052_0026.1
MVSGRYLRYGRMSAAGERCHVQARTCKVGSASLFNARRWEHAQPQPARRCSRDLSASASIFAYDTATSIFTAYNTLLLVPWCMMVFVPNLDFTRSVIKSNIFLYIFSGLFLYLFAAATTEALDAGASLGDEIQFLFLEAVADPKKMASMFSQDRPLYAAQDWAHLCTWDYFVGYWIYVQGQEKGIFTRHSLLLAFNSGPPGLISHFITEAITKAIRSKSETQPLATASQAGVSAEATKPEPTAKSQDQ